MAFDAYDPNEPRDPQTGEWIADCGQHLRHFVALIGEGDLRSDWRRQRKGRGWEYYYRED